MAQTDTETGTKKQEPQGILGTLRRNTPKILTDNAPRVVSTSKIAGAIAMILSGNKIFRTAGIFFISGNVIMTIFGRKKTDEERTKLQAEEEGKAKQANPILRHIGKAMQPHKYPVESGLTVFTMGSVFWVLAGAIGKTRSLGTFIAGLFSLASDANGAFNKENADSKDTSTFGYLKNRPILLSSLLNIGGDITTVVTGAMKYTKLKAHPQELIAGSFFLFANVFQAIYVNKNDYNIEKRPSQTTTDTPPPKATDGPQTVVQNTSEHAKLQSLFLSR